ncbi:MAG: methyltransferase domain-containing protein [Ignavibacteriales bacterium]|nr:methyltransferase domain-containing protein [Ignavibacteriales bacterium]
MFDEKDIENYYDQTAVHYRIWWALEKGKSLHYGLWFNETKNFIEALNNTNKYLSELAKINSTDKVLDAGCGVGGSAIYIAQKFNAKVTGITLSKKQVEKAKQNAQEEKVSELVNFEKRNYCSTGFEDKSFNVIWSIESVSSATSKFDFIKESFRLLKDGGRLVLSDYFKIENITSEKDKSDIQKWLNGWAISDIENAENFTKMMEEVGFKNIKVIDMSKEIMPSVKRMYYSFFPGGFYSLIYNFFKPSVSRFAKSHFRTAYYQYKTLKNGLWNYKIIYGEKV